MNWIWCSTSTRCVHSGEAPNITYGDVGWRGRKNLCMERGTAGQECGFQIQEYMLTVETQVYAILDEVFLAGEIEETSKQVVLTRLEHLDKLE